MQTHELTPHPAHPPSQVQKVSASVSAKDKNWLHLRWRIEAAGQVAVPPFAGRRRRDELWKTTCFELFIRSPGNGYSEFNFSPSEQWAAYDFVSYREGMADRAMKAAPAVAWRGGRTGLAIFDAFARFDDLPDLPWEFGMSAVIEEASGMKSYWALRHPSTKPDFHDPACFAGSLAARDSA